MFLASGFWAGVGPVSGWPWKHLSRIQSSQDSVCVCVVGDLACLLYRHYLLWCLSRHVNKGDICPFHRWESRGPGNWYDLSKPQNWNSEMYFSHNNQWVSQDEWDRFPALTGSMPNFWTSCLMGRTHERLIVQYPGKEGALGSYPGSLT